LGGGKVVTLITVVHPDKHRYIPVIFELKDRVREHILVSDDALCDKTEAKKLEETLHTLHGRYAISADITVIHIDEDSLKSIETLVESLKRRREVVLNANGADTLVTLRLAEAILRHEGKVIAYDEAEHTYNLLSRNGQTVHTPEHSMKLEDYMLLCGYTMEKVQTGNVFDTDMNVLRRLFGDTKRLFKTRRMLGRNQTDKIRRHHSDMYETMIQAGIIDVSGGRTRGDISRYGALFEQYVFKLISEYDFDDIARNVRVTFEEDEYGGIRNEFDILTIKNNRVGFIECKIGRHNPLEIVYKVDAVMDYFGRYARALIVHIESDVTTPDKNFRDGDKKRARAKRIEVYASRDFDEIFFHMMMSHFGAKRKQNRRIRR
jgi:hypothetical protein